ncbi:MAG: hypothetical protein C4521_08850 [Actinobacteria bacterium]|jgi:hypothetical protein|nr:MAG: hypothetical protein C4521_08850 [Actinomycetota bacterium]
MNRVRRALLLITLALAALSLAILPVSAGDENISGAVAPTGGQSIRDTLDSVSDTDDIYKVQLNAGDTVTMKLTGASGTDFDLYLYPPSAKDIWRNAEVAWSENPGTSSESISYDVPTSGTYYVDVASWDSVGPYTLSITSPSRVSIDVDKSTIIYSQSAKISGAISPAHTGATAKLLERPADSGSYVTAATGNLGADGKFEFTVSPRETSYYQVSWDGDVDHESATSGSVRVAVKPTVAIMSSASNVSLGSSVTLSGRVWPSHAGQTVNVDRKVKGSWKRLKQLKLNSDSRFSWSYKPTALGSYELRANFGGDSSHPGNVSGSVTFSVTSVPPS